MRKINNILKKKKILITGANGFIGLNVLKSFVKDDKFDIFAIIHKNISNDVKNLKNVKIIKADVTDENIVEKLNKIASFEIVIHIAGLASDLGCEKKFKKLNFDSVKLISALAKEKFIQISSSDVYGIKDFVDANENTKYHNFPNNPYPKYKIEAEKWIVKNCPNYVILRPAAVYGKNDLTIEKRAAEFFKNSSYLIHFGKWKGKNIWPLCDVENISKILLYVSKFDDFDNQAINIVDSAKITIDQYYKNIIKKYFPDKKYKTLYLPLFVGKILGFISTTLSNFLNLKKPLFDPTYYALYHVSSNLDFNNEKMVKILKLYKEKIENAII